MLQWVAVCCSVLQCVTVCCSVLQRVGSALQYSVLQPSDSVHPGLLTLYVHGMGCMCSLLPACPDLLKCVLYVCVCVCSALGFLHVCA